jgi:hypothetical protein
MHPGLFYPLKDINLRRLDENRGLKVLEENAMTAHDYYGEESREEEGETDERK